MLIGESVTFSSSIIIKINIINSVITLTSACFSVLAQNFKKGRRGEGVAFSRTHIKVFGQIYVLNGGRWNAVLMKLTFSFFNHSFQKHNH